MTKQQLAIIDELQRRGIKYLAIGGQAMRAYGLDRETRDLDIWVGRDDQNARALRVVLKSHPNLPTLERLKAPNLKMQILGTQNDDVEILTSVAGDPSFRDCYARRMTEIIDGQSFAVIAPPDLHTIKTACIEIMERDHENPTLPDIDRESARRTACKELRDIYLLDEFIRAPSSKS